MIESAPKAPTLSERFALWLIRCGVALYMWDTMHAGDVELVEFTTTAVMRMIGPGFTARTWMAIKKEIGYPPPGKAPPPEEERVP